MFYEVLIVSSADPGVCEDNPGIPILGQTCVDAVTANPRLCYRTDVIAACCSSCDEVSTGVAGTDSRGEEEDDDNSINKENVDVEDEIKDNDDEQNEEDEKQNQNYQHEEEETGEEEGKAGKDEIEHGESEGIWNEERLEREEAAENGKVGEIMAKTDAVLSIRVNLGCEYGDKEPSTCGQPKACDGAAAGCCRTCSQRTGTSNSSVTGPSTSGLYRSKYCMSSNMFLHHYYVVN